MRQLTPLLVLLILTVLTPCAATIWLGAHAGWTMDYYNISAFEADFDARWLIEDFGLLLGVGYSHLDGYYRPDYDEFFKEFECSGDTLYATLGYGYRFDYLLTLVAMHFGRYWFTPGHDGADIVDETVQTMIGFSAETLFTFTDNLGFNLRLTNSYYLGEPWHPAHYAIKGGLVFGL